MIGCFSVVAAVAVVVALVAADIVVAIAVYVYLYFVVRVGGKAHWLLKEQRVAAVEQVLPVSSWLLFVFYETWQRNGGCNLKIPSWQKKWTNKVSEKQK